MSSRVLLLLPTTTYRARDFIDAAERLGAETVVGSDAKQALQEIQPARGLVLELRDPARAADQIVAFAARYPLNAIVQTDDETAVVAAAASARLGLPHNPPEAAAATRRKDELRRLLRAAGVRTPSHWVFTVDEDDPVAVSQHQRYPVVLKPTFLAASRGVIRADDGGQFVAAFRRIAALLDRPDVKDKGMDAARSILVEEFVPGFEVAVEGLLVGGRLMVLALFDKPDPLDGPYFEETLYVTPSRLSAEAQGAIEATTAAAARALDLREGPIHAELRVDDHGPWLIELAARSIGGLCSRALRFGTGLSLEEVILRHALGYDMRGVRREAIASGVMMIPIPGEGVLAGVTGLEEARRVRGIEDVTISATIGQPVVPLPEGSSYLGFIFGRAASPDRVEAALREAHRCLAFDIRPD